MKINRGKGTRVFLYSGCALAAFAFNGVAVAQDGASAADNVESIVVTGSRVRGQAPIGSTVIALGREQIESSGAVTVDRMIKEIPQVFDLGVSENSRAQSGGSGNIVYGNTINLRGIGPYATLILVDGHRVVNNGRSTDPSILPTLGVERVEVIADGASAIYGSDAVAGVVNLIPRRTLDGAEVYARGGIAGEGDFHEYSAGVALGKVWDGGQIMVAYEHTKRSNLNGDDRSFFRSDQRASGGRDYRVTQCAPGTITAGGVTYAMPAQLTPANAAALVPGTSNLCDSAIGQDLFPEQTYNSVNATATLNLTDWVEFFADGFYSKREFQRFPAYATSNLTVPQTNAFFVRPAGFAGTSYTLGYNFRNDLPRDVSTGSAESWQITPGLRFKLPYDWQFEALTSFGETRDAQATVGGINNGALNAALASSDPATAFDPYGLGRTSQAVLDAISNGVFITPTNGKLRGYEARLNGPLFDIGGGMVKLALGYERQEFDVALGSQRGVPTTPLTYRYFDRNVDSLYAELSVPVFGASNAIPGFRTLELNAAVRHDKYSDVGNTTNPKFGINWSPVEGIRLRGSYGTSFRAPTIPEIYGNSNSLFGQNYQNPAGGAPVLGFALSGANLNLKPETASTWSVGADLDLLDRLSLSVTYFNVDYENQVTAYLSNLAILRQADEFAGTGIILQGQEARDRVAALIASGIGVVGTQIPGGDINNVNLFVDGRSNNLGVSITRGIDFVLNYWMDVGAQDRLSFNASGTYVTEYKVAITPAAPLLNQLNRIFQPLKFKARASVTWDHGPVSARVLATHIGGYTNNAITPSEEVSSYTPIDLSITWRIGDSSDTAIARGLSITGEVRNLFDIDPPYVNIAPSGNGSGGYDATATNPIGRLFALSVRKTF
ncbi:MAG: TonB-dependent receptor [Alphaproteobacteria bacterium]|nr:TonB-dependent receptor [Alphaproteobacteria bacterium]MBU0793393.1 TonB-dependent receptor [Alphaproteobacteria bacterium]MBU0877016.1 TonB-dependent receptor [Alphaproteobacteria bacterium]MBU1768442.1 TonB-dependent receptor [Alphaproteobacteria bacterium]